MNRRERIVWLDWARAFAILCVILVHVSEGVFPFNPTGLATYPIPQKAVLFSFFTLGRFGVPFFLFLTGYLLLPRKYTADQTMSFWRNRLLSLFITTEVWIVLMELFWVRVFNTALEPLSILKKMCFLEPSSISHMWYMPMILGVYCFLPFISNGLCSLNSRLPSFPLLLVLLFASIFPTVGLFLQVYGGSSLNSPAIDLSFGGGYFGLLLVFGYFVYCDKLKKLSFRFLVISAFVMFLATVCAQLYLYSVGYHYNVWYDFCPLIIASVCLFEIFSRISFPKSEVIVYLSRSSFGIYLIHSPIRILLIRHLSITDSWIQFVIVYIGTLLLSCLFVSVCSRFRILKKILFAA